MASWQEHSLSAAPQTSGFGTAATTGFKALLGEKPNVQLATEIVELDLMTGQVGAAAERLIGRRHGTISFKIPLEGFKDGYTPGAAGDPGTTGVIPHWFAMLSNVLGSKTGALVDTATKFWDSLQSSTSEYTSGGVLSATSAAITLDDATASDKVDGGQLIATALSATTTAIQMGFVQDKAVTVVTLFETSAQTVNSASANVYGTANAWISAAIYDQIPMTFEWVGEQTEACYILADAVCTGFTLTWESGEVSTIEFSYEFYDFSVDKTAGGLVVPAAFQRVPQIVGSDNGRATFDGSTQCGLESCSVVYSVETAPTKCHSAEQGISGIRYRKPRVKVQASIPWDSADLAYDAAGSSGNTGNHKWQSRLQLGTTTSIGVYVGNVIGKCFAFLVPAGIVTAVPQIADLDGSVGYQLEIEAGVYSDDSSDIESDTAATTPINSIFRAALA